MPEKYVTPGVYIQENNAFPGAAVTVETALPLFIGYTEKAIQHDKSLVGIPVKIHSLAEYTALFGQGFKHQFGLAQEAILNTPLAAFDPALLINPADFFYCYNSIRLFFQNGGSNCFILSLGTYGGDDPAVTQINLNDFSDDLFKQLEKELTPSIVVLPDIMGAFAKDSVKCYDVYRKLLQHCSNTQSRFAILDVHCSNDLKNDIDLFRQNIGGNYLSYGAAYYPWLHTSIVPDTEIDFTNLSISISELKAILPAAGTAEIFSSWQTQYDATETISDKAAKEAAVLAINKELHQSLMNVSAVYKQIMNEISNRLNLLPPSGAMAGIYCMVDNTRGVWKAPANVSVQAVKSTSVNITNGEQEGMNVDTLAGKSINAIRPFTGNGILVWGARTLDGNSQDWRYINVRRTIIMIEQSLQRACRMYIFEPNDAATWTTIRATMENFLFNLWKQGALAGVKPVDAYNVQVGLGTTMTADDIRSGQLVVSVMLAVVRPAEFIIITFRQLQQQAS